MYKSQTQTSQLSDVVFTGHFYSCLPEPSLKTISGSMADLSTVSTKAATVSAFLLRRFPAKAICLIFFIGSISLRAHFFESSINRNQSGHSNKSLRK